MALLQISEPGQAPDPHQRRIAVGIDLGGTSYYAKRDGSSNNFILSATPTGAAIDFSINANYAIQTVDYEADTVTFASASGVRPKSYTDTVWGLVRRAVSCTSRSKRLSSSAS